jgi:hypothetical protein
MWLVPVKMTTEAAAALISPAAQFWLRQEWSRPVMSRPVSRGFHRARHPSADQAGRVPPGQYVTQDFPALSAGPTPHTPLPEWTFSIRQGGGTLKSWSWPPFQALPVQEVTVDIHCVTRWTKLDTMWRGVSVDTLLDQVEQDSSYVLAFSTAARPGCWCRTNPVSGKPMVTTETDKVRTIGFEVPGWPGHRAGQHLDVRLTAEDGYTAERSYSVATADGEPVAITVERLDDGEVSPYLTEELRAGDELELRGPIGQWFVWDSSDAAPLLLVAGGSGIVPLRAILRHHQRIGSQVPVRLLCSSPTLADVIYHDGPTSFVEAVAGNLVALGYSPGRVKTERFGGK